MMLEQLQLTHPNLEVGGVDLTLRAGNIIYVAENGDDTYRNTIQDSSNNYTRIKFSNTAGDTVLVFPGAYTETF